MEVRGTPMVSSNGLFLIVYSDCEMPCTTRSPIHSRMLGSWPSQAYSSLPVVLGTTVASCSYWLAAWPKPF
ncbi:hypothetical protein D3C86_1815410 [compost metagenome]